MFVHPRMYVYGGYDGSKCRNDLYVLDLGTHTQTTPPIHEWALGRAG